MTFGQNVLSAMPVDLFLAALFSAEILTTLVKVQIENLIYFRWRIEMLEYLLYLTPVLTFFFCIITLSGPGVSLQSRVWK